MKKLLIILFVLLLAGCTVKANETERVPISLVEVVNRMIQQKKLKSASSLHGTQKVFEHINGNHNAIVQSVLPEIERTYKTLDEANEKKLCEEHLLVLSVKTAVKDGNTWFFLDTREESSGEEETIFAVFGEVDNTILDVKPGDRILAGTLENTQMMSVQILEEAKD